MILTRYRIIALAALVALSAIPVHGAGAGYKALRERMVKRQIEDRGVKNPAVLEAMKEVPRHLFVPERYRSEAYEDHPLPIGLGQTISQPYIVAFMTELLQLKPGDRVFELGTGSGYQAAVASRVAGEVFTVEIYRELAASAEARLAGHGYSNVTVREGDGYFGWEEKAPFDAIIVTAAADHIPPPLLEQLRPGGRLVIPLGGPFSVQQLVMVNKDLKGRISERGVMLVRFVPLLGH